MAQMVSSRLEGVDQQVAARFEWTCESESGWSAQPRWPCAFHNVIDLAGQASRLADRTCGGENPKHLALDDTNWLHVSHRFKQALD